MCDYQVFFKHFYKIFHNNIYTEAWNMVEKISTYDTNTIRSIVHQHINASMSIVFN